MKSRQKFTVSEKHIHGPKTGEPDECHLDLRVKKKIASNPLIQKNISFLHTYNNLFKKPAHQQIGDTEAYFKQSLRSESFDLIRDLHLEAHLVKSVKSFENINKRKVRSKRTVLTPRRNSSRPFQPQGRSAEETQEPLPEVKAEPSEQQLEVEKETSSVLEEDYFKELYFAKRVEEVDSSESESETETEEDGDVTPKVEEDIEDRLDDILNTVAQDLDNIMEGEEGAVDEEIFETDLDVPADEGDDDEIKEVEQMIEQAAEELQQVAEENQNLMQVLDEGEGEGEDEEQKPKEGAAAGDSAFKFDPAIDSAILKELDDAERQAKETANVIFQLKTRVGELALKEKMTEEEAKELEAKNKELEQLMVLFEEKVKRIQQLIMQSNLFESMTPIQPMLQTRHKEDTLPQVLVCGITEEDIPKIIVCDKKGIPSSKPKKQKTPRSPQTTAQCTPRRPESPIPQFGPMSPMMQQPQMNMFAQKLNECICMQEKLAAENANLEGTRYELQGEIMNKDQTVESLQRQLAGLQAELRMVCQENCALSQKLQQGGSIQTGSCPISPHKQQRYSKGRAVCPADIESRLQEYSENTQNLEHQLHDMENEVKAMQEELTAVQRERAHLEHHRKMMCPPPTYFMPPPCVPVPPCLPMPCRSPPPCTCDEDTGSSADQQVKEMKEQYNLLQDDYKSKLKEVSTLRAENQSLQGELEAERDNLKAYQEKIRKLEDELKAIVGEKGKGAGLKEQLMELEQQLSVAKQRFKDAQDELEELRLLVQDQQQQMDDYRNKYLEAMQQVEEQRRQIDLMEMENQRVSEQVNLEIQRVKNQFQEKVQELMPLPDILKNTQMKLQEAQQMHLLAERNNESISRELKMYKDKLATLTNQLDMAKSDEALGKSEKDTLLQKIADLEKEVEDIKEENYNLKNGIAELEDRLTACQLESDSRAHEIIQLETNLENVREESARQVARTKDRCEIVRKSMQNQINDLERQLAQCRAQAKAAQKDRDEIRQKMQAQILNLNENFEDATMRIRSLQGHVNFLKNTYGVVTTDPCPKPAPPDPCNCADIESRLQEYSENTQNLEHQLHDMENEVKAMQEELTAVQRERAHLEHHRKMMCPPPTYFMPPPCVPVPPCLPMPCRSPPPCTCDEDTGSSADQQVKEMKEQYNLLQDDYKSKLKEVSTLRAENQSLQGELEAERDNLKAYQEKIRKLEDELKAIVGEKGKGAGLKEQLMELEQQLSVAKQRFKDAQDELEELRLLVQDQQQQMDDYRNKYLEAMQQVEEQRRQIDLMEMENQRVSEQVNLEIQRVKNQFQEKVQELMPLPDILKNTQMKLQEAQQMHLLAERNNESISRELKMYKDKLATLTNQLDMAKSDEALGKSEKDTLLQKIADLEKEVEDIKEENYNLKNGIAELEDRLTACQLESDSRAHEIIQLETNLENVREESARQVARTKDRCEIVRKSMQNQINDLERQLAQCRAQAKAAQKDRDEIRQKMQAQILNLNENFEDATMRIRSLQGHVNFLKNTYGVVTTDPCPKPAPPDPCNCGADY
nr:unnamed protein product [Callosobruchus chinensis]